MAIVLGVAFVLFLGFEVWEYTSWRNRMIEWDIGTIERMCGGDTEADRLLEVRFIKKWEYNALKKTSAGKQVWLHWKLSKRRCGNWGLVDKPQEVAIRPFELRFPNGAPYRQRCSCLGFEVRTPQSGADYAFMEINDDRWLTGKKRSLVE
jgi:hypothetical protein